MSYSDNDHVASHRIASHRKSSRRLASRHITSHLVHITSCRESFPRPVKWRTDNSCFAQAPQIGANLSKPDPVKELGCHPGSTFVLVPAFYHVACFPASGLWHEGCAECLDRCVRVNKRRGSPNLRSETTSQSDPPKDPGAYQTKGTAPLWRAKVLKQTSWFGCRVSAETNRLILALPMLDHLLARVMVLLMRHRHCEA